MTTNAKIYISVFLALGLCVVLGAIADGRPIDAPRFTAYVALAIFASFLKFGMPAFAGNMSFNFVFILLGILDLSFPQTLLIGSSALLIESFQRQKIRSSKLQILFAIANLAVAIYCTDLVYHSKYLTVKGFLVPTRLALASTAFFIASTFPAAAVASLSRCVPLLRVWRTQYFWSYPYYLIGAALAFGYRVASQAFGWEIALASLPVAHLVYRIYNLYLGRLEDGKIHAEEMASLHLRTIEALALAIEAKDNTTHDHLKRVQVYAMELGKELGLKREELEALRAAALLHDIGKLAVPEHIISKPGRLTLQEFEKMKIHPVVGAEILEQVQFPYPVVPIVRAHHEKWNGTGYPLGLRATEIPIGARILSAVDAFDALASDRQYRRALPIGEAMAKVEKESGTSFDPTVVSALKRRYVDLEAKAQEEGSVSGKKLSLNLKVERGGAPAAGFEASRPSVTHNKSAEDDAVQAFTRARRDLQRLVDLDHGPDSTLHFNESLAVFAVRLRRLIPFDAIAVYLVEGDNLVPEYVSGENHRLFSSLQIPMGQGLSGWVAENRMPILNGNPSVEPGYLNDANAFSTLRSALAVPLDTAEGSTIGVLALYHEGRDAFTRDHLRLLETIAPKLALFVEQAAPTAESPDVSTVDRLTGLPHGRTAFLHLESEIIRCKRLNTSLGVLVCSVDGLKEVNQRFGRIEGDKTLRQIASALKDACSDSEYMARLGTHEFVIVIPGMRPEFMQEKIARLAKVSYIRGKESLTLIAGEAYFPEDGTEPEQLIGEADRRMFRSKHQRRPQDAPRPDAGRWVQ